MGFKIEYASQRREVWNWYWRYWRKRFWKTHALLFLAVASAAMVGSYAGNHHVLSPMSFVLALAFGLLSIIWLPVYPMLRFKLQMRTLEIDQEGISTTIGNRSGRRSWKEIESVAQEDSQIVVLGRKGGAFLVPTRAFESAEAQQAFFSFAQSALAASADGSKSGS